MDTSTIEHAVTVSTLTTDADARAYVTTCIESTDAVGDADTAFDVDGIVTELSDGLALYIRTATECSADLPPTVSRWSFDMISHDHFWDVVKRHARPTDVEHDAWTPAGDGYRHDADNCTPCIVASVWSKYRPAPIVVDALDIAADWHKAGPEAHGLLSWLVERDFVAQHGRDLFDVDQLDMWLAETVADIQANRN